MIAKSPAWTKQSIGTAPIRKPRFFHENQLKPNLPLQQLTKRYKTTVGSLQGQLGQATKALEDKMTALRSRNGSLHRHGNARREAQAAAGNRQRHEREAREPGYRRQCSGSDRQVQAGRADEEHQHGSALCHCGLRRHCRLRPDVPGRSVTSNSAIAGSTDRTKSTKASASASSARCQACRRARLSIRTTRSWLSSPSRSTVCGRS